MVDATDASDTPGAGLRRELAELDRHVYEAVAGARTPTADRMLRGLSRTADKSVLWLSIAAALAVVGGPSGRRAAVAGVASIGVTSAVVNLGVKPLARRRRPQREVSTDARHVPMPHSTSFPSGHSASAFAFAEGVGSELPWLAGPLRVAAAAVAYSRVHTGVHYPGDVIAGSLIGMSAGEVVPLIGQHLPSTR